MINTVFQDGAAAVAGLECGDTIVRITGSGCSWEVGIPSYLLDYSPGRLFIRYLLLHAAATVRRHKRVASAQTRCLFLRLLLSGIGDRQPRRRSSAANHRSSRTTWAGVRCGGGDFSCHEATPPLRCCQVRYV